MLVHNFSTRPNVQLTKLVKEKVEPKIKTCSYLNFQMSIKLERQLILVIKVKLRFDLIWIADNS